MPLSKDVAILFVVALCLLIEYAVCPTTARWVIEWLALWPGAWNGPIWSTLAPRFAHAGLRVVLLFVSSWKYWSENHNYFAIEPADLETDTPDINLATAAYLEDRSACHTTDSKQEPRASIATPSPRSSRRTMDRQQAEAEKKKKEESECAPMASTSRAGRVRTKSARKKRSEDYEQYMAADEKAKANEVAQARADREKHKSRSAQRAQRYLRSIPFAFVGILVPNTPYTMNFDDAGSYDGEVPRPCILLPLWYPLALGVLAFFILRWVDESITPAMHMKLRLPPEKRRNGRTNATLSDHLSKDTKAIDLRFNFLCFGGKALLGIFFVGAVRWFFEAPLDEQPLRDVLSWNSHVGPLLQRGILGNALFWVVIQACCGVVTLLVDSKVHNTAQDRVHRLGIYVFAGAALVLATWDGYFLLARSVAVVNMLAYVFAFRDYNRVVKDVHKRIAQEQNEDSKETLRKELDWLTRTCYYTEGKLIFRACEVFAMAGFAVKLHPEYPWF